MPTRTGPVGAGPEQCPVPLPPRAPSAPPPLGSAGEARRPATTSGQKGGALGAGSTAPRRSSRGPKSSSGRASEELSSVSKLTRAALESHQRQLGPVRASENGAPLGFAQDLTKASCEALWWKRKLDRSDEVQARCGGFEVPEKVNDTFIEEEEFAKAHCQARDVMKMVQKENRGSIRMGPDWNRLERLASTTSCTPEPGALGEQHALARSGEVPGAPPGSRRGRSGEHRHCDEKWMQERLGRLVELSAGAANALGKGASGSGRRLGTGCSNAQSASDQHRCRLGTGGSGRRPGTGQTGRSLSLTATETGSAFAKGLVDHYHRLDTPGDYSIRLGTGDTARSIQLQYGLRTSGGHAAYGVGASGPDSGKLSTSTGFGKPKKCGAEGGRPPPLPPTLLVAQKWEEMKKENKI